MSTGTNHHRLGRAHRRLAAAALAALVALVLPGTAMARTEVVRNHIEFGPAPAPFFSEVCGVEVELTLDLHITHKSFNDDPLRHRQEEQGTIEWSSDHGTVVQFWRHAGIHEVAEVLEELEPDLFLVRVRATSDGTLQLRTPQGRPLVTDAGTIAYDDLALWDRAEGTIMGPLESTVTRVAGPHPLLDDATFDETVCGELAP